MVKVADCPRVTVAFAGGEVMCGGPSTVSTAGLDSAVPKAFVTRQSYVAASAVPGWLMVNELVVAPPTFTPFLRH